MTITSKNFTCSKTFFDFPCCHRQWDHNGHCRYVHGYSREFTFWFKSTQLNKNGFVVDFSSLKTLESKLKDYFDHTFLVNFDDPLMDQWEKLHRSNAIDLRVMKNVGMEFTSQQIWEWANHHLFEVDKGRSCCWKTESRENNSNSAAFEKVPSWYQS